MDRLFLIHFFTDNIALQNFWWSVVLIIVSCLPPTQESVVYPLLYRSFKDFIYLITRGIKWIPSTANSYLLLWYFIFLFDLTFYSGTFGTEKYREESNKDLYTHYIYLLVNILPYLLCLCLLNHCEVNYILHHNILPLNALACGLSRWLSGKEPTCQCKRWSRHGFNSCVRKILFQGHHNPLQYPCLDNPMDRGSGRL